MFAELFPDPTSPMVWLRCLKEIEEKKETHNIFWKGERSVIANPTIEEISTLGMNGVFCRGKIINSVIFPLWDKLANSKSVLYRDRIVDQWEELSNLYLTLSFRRFIDIFSCYELCVSAQH